MVILYSLLYLQPLNAIKYCLKDSAIFPDIKNYCPIHGDSLKSVAGFELLISSDNDLLTINSFPSDSRLTIDNELLGSTPVKNSRALMKTGKHEVKLKHEGLNDLTDMLSVVKEDSFLIITGRKVLKDGARIRVAKSGNARTFFPFDKIWITPAIAFFSLVGGFFIGLLFSNFLNRLRQKKMKSIDGILTFLSEGSVQQRFELKGPEVKIGRDPTNDLELLSEDLMPFHCLIRKETDEYVLYDLYTPNGTMVNGEKIQRKILQNGDKIEIGEFEILYSTLKGMEFLPITGIEGKDKLQMRTASSQIEEIRKSSDSEIQRLKKEVERLQNENLSLSKQIKFADEIRVKSQTDEVKIKEEMAGRLEEIKKRDEEISRLRAVFKENAEKISLLQKEKRDLERKMKEEIAALKNLTSDDLRKKVQAQEQELMTLRKSPRSKISILSILIIALISFVSGAFIYSMAFKTKAPSVPADTSTVVAAVKLKTDSIPILKDTNIIKKDTLPAPVKKPKSAQPIKPPNPAPVPIPQPPSDYGYISVNSFPAGAKIYVDGDDKGVTPKRLQVTATKHVVKLEYENVTKLQEVFIIKNETVPISVKFDK